MVPLRSFRAVLFCLAASTAFGAGDKLAGLTKAVTAFKLPNGAQFFVVERPHSPLVSFHLRVRAGVSDEPSGRGGLATLALLNFLEGTESYGTRNQTAEKTALAQAAKLFDAARADLAKGDQIDEIQKGRSDFQARSAFDEAAQFGIRPRFFDSVLGQNGVTAFDLRPTADYSDLSMTLPSNRVELWFRMVSSWLQSPSTRFFPKSKELVLQQRERVANTGALMRERAFGAPFTLHPYGAIASGEVELSGATPGEVLAFLKTHYVPANLTIAMVGDIAPAEARRLAEAYIGKLPSVAPPAAKEATITKADFAGQIRLASGEAAVFAAGWPRPASSDPTDTVFEVLQALLVSGPGSRLHDKLMIESRTAGRLAVTSRFPGGRYPGLFVLEAEPLAPWSHEDVENALAKELTAAAKDGFTNEEMERARAAWRNRLLADSQTASGRAAQLVQTQTEQGTYRVEELLSKLEAVTAADCQRVLNEYVAGKPYFSILQFTAIAGGGQ